VPGNDASEAQAGPSSPVHRARHHRRSSALVDRADIEALENVRRQKLNLEFLYGSGPTGRTLPLRRQRLRQASSSGSTMRPGRGSSAQCQGIAIIADPATTLTC